MRKVGGRCVPVALAALLAAACTTESGSRADAGAVSGEDGGGSGPDAAIGSAGLVLEFRGVPTLPASLGGDFDAELEEVRLDLENVRAVGDAAPGDERTSRDELRLDWSGEGDDDGGDGSSNEPVIVTFDQAPPGLYSNVFAQLTSYRLRGEVELEEDNERDFEVDDAPPAGIALSIPLGGVTLEAGETRRVVIEVSCVDAVIDTPWDQVDEEEGNLVVDEEDAAQIDPIRAAMQMAFVYQGSDEVTGGDR
jgi:hypothetical protein